MISQSFNYYIPTYIERIMYKKKDKRQRQRQEWIKTGPLFSGFEIIGVRLTHVHVLPK